MDPVEDFLQHFGVKGMKWGVRRRRGADGLVEKSTDVKNAEAARAKVGRKGDTKALSNKELQDLVTRMNLEQQFSNLNAKTKKNNPAVKFVANMLVQSGQQQAQRIVNDEMGKLVGKMLANRK